MQGTEDHDSHQVLRQVCFAVYDFADVGNPLDVTEGSDGSLFLSDIFPGRIFKISHTGQPARPVRVAARISSFLCSRRRTATFADAIPFM